MGLRSNSGFSPCVCVKVCVHMFCPSVSAFFVNVVWMCVKINTVGVCSCFLKWEQIIVNMLLWAFSLTPSSQLFRLYYSSVRLFFYSFSPFVIYFACFSLCKTLLKMFYSLIIPVFQTFVMFLLKLDGCICIWCLHVWDWVFNSELCVPK